MRGRAGVTTASNVAQSGVETESLEPSEAVRIADETSEDERGDDASERQTRGQERPAGGSLLSFRGLAPTQNRTLVDGVSGDQTFRGGARGGAAGGPSGAGLGGVAYGGESLGSVRIAAHGYSAQYGGGAGGLVTSTSARGGGRVRGGAGYSVVSNVLAATKPFLGGDALS